MTAPPRRDEVRPRVAEGDEAAGLFEPDELPEPPAGDVLEEDPLDGIVGAVGEDLLAARVDEVRHPADPAV